MIKIFKGIFSLIHLIFIKVLHPKSIKFCFLQDISISCKIKIKKKGKIIFGKKIHINNKSSILADGGVISVSNGSCLGSGNIIVAHKSIKIGSGCMFGPNVLIFDHDHDYNSENGIRDLKYKSDEIEIGNNVNVNRLKDLLRFLCINNDVKITRR